MAHQNKGNKNYIKQFNPEVEVLDDSFQDYFLLKQFNAGTNYQEFNDFLCTEAYDYKESGDGVTHIIFDIMKDSYNKEVSRKVVAYFTLNATAIPFEDRTRNSAEEYKRTGEKYEVEICGVSAVEVKMLAVDINYQNVFYEYQNEQLPIAAWILRLINDVAENNIGYKVIYLHSLPEAISFYEQNGFKPVEKNMLPLYSVDDEFTPMYLTVKPFVMNYDK